MRPSLPTFIACTCLLLSGAAGLVYEVAWIRKASLTFGSTVHALSTVLAVFFFGLALGSEIFGRRAPRTTRPLRVYAGLEIALALLALASLPALDVAAGLLRRLHPALEQAPFLFALARALLVAVVILPPSVLMGGTLPLFCRQFARRTASLSASVGLLYALNTLGAVGGCLLAGFVLLPSVGTANAVRVGAALSLLAAFGVLALRLRPLEGVAAHQSLVPVPASTSVDASSAPLRTGWIGALFFMTGFVALAHEVVWSRFLVLLVRNTVYTYTLTLSTVLLGIVLGSLLAARLGDRTRHRAAWFGAFQVGTAILVLALLHLPPALWRSFGSPLSTCFALLLPPALFSGASFPLAVRMVTQDAAGAAQGAGRMAALNTCGGVAGALLAGFFLLPTFGIAPSVQVTTGLCLASGFAAWLLTGERRTWRRRAVAIGIALLLWIAIPRTGTRVPQDYLAPRASLVDWREGLESNLAVIRKQDLLELEIDRWWQGQDRKGHQIVAAHLPMLVHSNPRRVLVVGVGAGQTPSRFLMYDELQRLDCVDIEPAVFDLIAQHFDGDWMQDPRVRLVRDDGRSFLAFSNETYDVVSLELGQVFRPGIAAFYSADFYRTVRRRLAPQGIVAQFVPTAFLTAETFAGVVRSFLEVFPQSTLWYNTSELLMLGTNADRFEIDAARLDRLSTPAIHRDLDWSAWGGHAQSLHRPAVFLGGYLLGPAGLRAVAGSAVPYSDDRPVLEYRVLEDDPFHPLDVPIASALARHLEPVEAIVRGTIDPDTLVLARSFRDQNLSDVRASALVRQVETLVTRGDTAGITTVLREALEANPANAQALRLQGDLLVVQGESKAAVPWYERALALRDDDAASRRGLAMALHQQGRFAEAVAQYRMALSTFAEDAGLHNNLATALAQLGDLEGSITHFEAALRLNPEMPGARQNLERLRQLRRAQAENAAEERRLESR